jgi:hypothetical protein
MGGSAVDYEYGRIRILADRLEKGGVAPETAARIMAGGEAIKKTSSPEKKAAWFTEAMNRMDALLDEETRRRVREDCTCCLGGKRQEVSKGIGKKYESLEDRIRAANDARFVFGNSVTMQDDGRVRVSFYPEGQESFKCVCLPKAKGPISVTYCYCCGGHVKHHLQNALRRKLALEVHSSALESDGKRPCTFLFTIEE